MSEEFTEVRGYNLTSAKRLQIQIRMESYFMHRAKCITIHCNFSYRVQVIVKMKKADLDMLEAFINQCGGEMIQVQDRAERRTAATITLATQSRPYPPSDSENRQDAVPNTQVIQEMNGKYCSNFLLCFTDLSPRNLYHKENPCTYVTRLI